MSWIKTEIECNNCSSKNIVAWRLPNGVVSINPDKNQYAIATCQKEFDRFNVTFTCKKCGKSVSLTYSKEEFNNIEYSFIE